MRYLNLFLALLFIFSCVRTNNNSSSDVLIENPMTLELSFGFEDLPDDFLLATPTGFNLDASENIYILDESQVKIYSPDGKAIGIFGGKGQGPGEFDSFVDEGRSFISITDNGLKVIKYCYDSNYHLFNSDNEFVSRDSYDGFFLSTSLLKNKDLLKVYPSEIFYQLGENETVYTMPCEKNMRDNNEFSNGIYYQKEGKVTEINFYNEINIISKNNRGREFFIPLGLLSMASLPDKRIVYTHSSFDVEDIDGKKSYILRVFSLDEMTERQIKHNYNTIVLNEVEEFISKYKNIIQANPGRDNEYYEGVLEEIDKKVQTGLNAAPIRKLRADGNIIFAFTFEKTSTGKTLANIFDAESLEHIADAYFDFIPSVIKNGKAYRLITKKDEFPKLEVYKIDSKVYKK